MPRESDDCPRRAYVDGPISLKGCGIQRHLIRHISTPSPEYAMVCFIHGRKSSVSLPYIMTYLNACSPASIISGPRRRSQAFDEAVVRGVSHWRGNLRAAGTRAQDTGVSDLTLFHDTISRMGLGTSIAYALIRSCSRSCCEF